MRAPHALAVGALLGVVASCAGGRAAPRRSARTAPRATAGPTADAGPARAPTPPPRARFAQPDGGAPRRCAGRPVAPTPAGRALADAAARALLEALAGRGPALVDAAY